MKRRKIVFIVYFIMLLIAFSTVELYIHSKKEKLLSEEIEQLKESFPNENHTLEALYFEDIDGLDYIEVPIPSAPENSSKQEKKYWRNKFMGIEHLYKLNSVGWQMVGNVYYPAVASKTKFRAGVIEYFYFPYMIGVPKNVPFDEDIAKSIIKKSLDKVYYSSEAFNHFLKKRGCSNEYYEMVGNILPDSINKQQMPFYNHTTGTMPIFNDNKYTGKHWFGLQKIGPYRVLLAYNNRINYTFQEKDGFNASLKDRVIYYSFVFFVLILFTIFFLYRDVLKSALRF